MPAYIIARVDAQDWDAYRQYMRHTPRVVHKFGGRFIARGGSPETLEGDAETRRIVLIEFPSVADAKAFYHSDDYRETKRLRQGGGAAQFVVVDGYPMEDWNAAVRESEQLALPR